MTSRCGETEHRFAKFDEATIFCRRCGEQRVMDVQALIAKLPQPIYLSCPGPHVYRSPFYPTTPVYPWWSGTSVTYTDINTTNTTIDNGSTTTKLIG